MKKILFLLVLSFAANCVMAQTGPIFMFEKFCLAKVFFKNGAVTKAQMNYDASRGKMYFKQGEDYMELTNENTIDSVVWSGRKFIPKYRRFWEEFHFRGTPVYVDWLLKDVHLGSKGAFGLPTQGKVETLKLGNFSGGVPGNYQSYDQQGTYDKDCWKRKTDNTYYIMQQGKPKRIRSIKNLCKLYPLHEAEIRSFAEKEKIDMKIVQDALKIIEYTLSL